MNMYFADRQKANFTTKTIRIMICIPFDTEDHRNDDSICYQRFCCKIEFAVTQNLIWTRLKVGIGGKYINLNKIAKIKHIPLKFNRLLIFVILYSLQCQIEGHAV